MEKNKHVVIVGGGFGGVYAAKELLNRGFCVTLINPTNFFSFTPLLHEVATGTLVHEDVTFEYESFFKSKNFEFVRAKATNVDVKRKLVCLEFHSIPFDYLVVATGSRTNTDLVPGCEHAIQLKTAEDALLIKQRIIMSAQSVHKHVCVTVIGGGPTGLELVTELSALINAFKKRSKRLTSVIRLIHSNELLGGIDDIATQKTIKDKLKKDGVELVLSSYATEITDSKVLVSEDAYSSDVTILAAGMVPNSDWVGNELEKDEKGNILSDLTLRCLNQEYVFALGDVMNNKDHIVPKLAQTAVKQASVVAKNISFLESGSDLIEYKPKVKGMLFSLGIGQGIGLIGGFTIKGFFVWYLWRTVYLFKTPGLVNKFRVAISWTLHLFFGRNLTEQ